MLKDLIKRPEQSDDDPDQGFVFEALEPRVLLSADLAGVLAQAVLAEEQASAAAAEELVIHEHEKTLLTSPLDSTSETQSDSILRHEIAFVDTGAKDYQLLVDDLLTNQHDDKKIEVILLDSNRNGIEQITEALSEYQNIDAVHIISHGSNGNIQLGNTRLNAGTLTENNLAIALWSESFAESGDILFYGCNLAATENGQSLMESLSLLTNTDIAASDDLTGQAELGGDWELEYTVGTIDTDVAISTDLQASYQGVLGVPPIAHWTFDTDTTDSSGNNYDGALPLPNDATIDTTSATNKVGGGKLSLDGTDDQVDLSAHIASLSTLTEGSISAWFNTTDAGFNPIFSVTDSNSPDDYAYLEMQSGRLLFEVRSGGATADYTMQYGTPLNDGNWHHVSITVDSGGNHFYVDGVEILAGGGLTYAPGSTANTQFFDDVNNVNTISIGAFASSFSSTGRFTGLLDDVQIHDYALTSDQVALLATVNDAPSFHTPSFTPHTISTDANGARTVVTADMDGDGDLDLLSASTVDDKIAWYENDGSQNFTEHVISTVADGAESVTTADVDGDGDMDILSASFGDDKVAWYENDGSENFTERVITTGANGVRSVTTADVDGDGDMDVLSASQNDNKIAWYKNDGSGNFTEHVISTGANGTYSVTTADVDGDGDIDVLSASSSDNKIAWYENDGSESFTERVISTNAATAVSVTTADVDGDGDMDVLSASFSDDKIAWYENDGSESFTERVISTGANGAYSVTTTDVDGDGDMDVLSASVHDDKLSLYENDGSQNFTEHVITTGANSARSVTTADVDGDGDVDVLSASSSDNKIAWYENVATALDGNPTFIEDGAAVVLDADVDLSDPELDALNGGLGDYDGTSLTLVRNGGASTEDILSFNDGNGITLVGANLIKNSQTIATFDITTTPGQLVITFTNANGETPTSTDVDNILHQITYANSSDTPPASAQIDWIFNDGNTGAQGTGGALTISGSTTVSITAVNDVPVNTVPNAQSVDEDTVLAIGGISVNDVDGNLSTVQLTVSSGVLNVTLSGAASVSAGTNGTTDLTLSGTQTDINATLASLTYQGTLNFNGSDTLTVLSTDGDATTDSDTVAITVNAVNDAPTNTIPPSITVTEDVATALTGISITDVDAAGTSVLVTLSVPAGSLTATTGAGVTVGGSASALTLTGSVSNINAFIATSSVSYTTAAHANGSVTLTVLTSDQGNTGSGGALTDSDTVTLNITAVNDSPIVATNTGASVAEGSSVAITNAHLNEDDVDDSDIGLTYSVTAGLANGQLELTTNAGVAVTSFTQDDIDNNRLIYVHNGSQTSSDSFDFSLADGGENGAVATTGTFNFTVSNVNDVPVNTVPNAQSVDEDTVLAIGGISVNDVDGNLSTVQLTVSSGVLNVTLSGAASVSAGTNGTTDLTLSGTQTDINATLASLTYQGTLNFNGSDTLTVLSTDGDATTDSDTVAITVNAVNDAPKFGTPSFTPHTITTGANNAQSVVTADVDGDGDMDVLSASFDDDKIAWYENDGSENFTEHVISTGADGAFSVTTADVDGDGDMDVLSASDRDNKIAWYENDGGEIFTEHVITTVANDARSVTTADVDGDGDLDVLSASRGDNKIAWYENDGSENFSPHTITGSALGAISVTTADVDDDGDMDVLSASYVHDKIAWYENDGSEDFTEHVITTDADDTSSVTTADVDGDGDIDVLSASGLDDKVAWYENEGSGNFTEHVISTGADSARAVTTADVDGDGDMDVLSASAYDDKITWYENDGSENFTEHVITTEADFALSVTTADVDGDGDIDVLSASQFDDKIAWYENSPINALDATPTFIEDGTAVVLDADVDLSDSELDALNGGLGDYDGASLTLVRNGGVSTEDILSFNDGNGITLVGSNLIKNSQTIATFDITTTPGQLVITFTNVNGETPTSTDVDNILHQITYANSSDTPPASAQIDWTFNDGNTGDQGAGNALEVIGSTTVSIAAVNDVPVITNSAGTISYTEQNSAVAIDSGLTIADPDGKNGSINAPDFSAVVIISTNFDPNDVLSFSNTANIQGNLVGNTLTLTVVPAQTATVADFEAALRSVTFFNGNDDPGILDRTVSFSFNDGLANSNTDTRTIQFTAVNDSPALATNTGTTVSEGTAGNIITTTMLNEGDPDDAGTGLTYTVTIPANGTLRLSGVALFNGNTFTQDDIDNNRITYDHDGSETISDSLVFDLADGGEDGATALTGQTFSITITPANDAPSFTGILGGYGVPENAIVHPFETGISIVDADNLDFDSGILTIRSGTPGLATDQLSLLQQDGLTLSGNNVLNNGVTIGTWVGGANGADLTVTFNANAYHADVNLVFSHIEYVSTHQNPTSSPAISATISDGDGGSSGNLNGSVILVAVNDAPDGSDSTITINEGTTLTLAQGHFGFSDVENHFLKAVWVTSLPANGVLQLNGTNVNSGDSISASDIDSNLLTYTPAANANGNNYASFTFEVQDTGFTAFGGIDRDQSANTITFDVTPVNDNAPVFTSPTTASIAENTTAIHQVTVTDSDLPGDTFTYSIAGSGADDARFSIDGAGNLRFIAAPDFETPTDANIDNDYIVDVQVFDGVNTTTQTITVTVFNGNEMPTTSGLANITVNEDTVSSVKNLFAAFDDIEDLDPALTYTISNNTNNALFSSTVINHIAGSLTLNYAPDQNGTADIIIRATDTGGLYVETTFTVTVNPVNDAPIANNDLANVNEGGSVVIDLGANDSDVDNSLDLNSLTIISGPTNGSLVSNGDGTVTYTHNDSETLTDSFSYTIKDSTGATSNIATVNLTVTPVNDAPVQTTPPDQVIDINTDLVFSNANGNPISISDIDAGNNPLQVTLTVANGVLNLASTTSLLFTAGDGIADSTLTFTGTLADINTALDGLIFHPDDGSTGASNLQIIVNDLGSGSGNAQLTTNNVAIEINSGFILEPPPVDPTPDPEVPDPVTPDEPITNNPEDPEDEDPEDEDEDEVLKINPITDQPGNPQPDEIAIDLDPVIGNTDPYFEVEPEQAEDLVDVNLEKNQQAQTKTTTTPISGKAQLLQAARIQQQKIATPEKQIYTIDPGLLHELDRLEKEISEVADQQTKEELIIKRTTEVGSVVLFVGFVKWILQASSLFASVLGTLPAWRWVDPIPVLTRSRDEKEKNQAKKSRDLTTTLKAMINKFRLNKSDKTKVINKP